MPWGNKKDDELPESLRGLTPEQIAAKLADAESRAAAGVTVDTKIDAAFERFGAALTEQLTTKFGEFEARLPAPKVDPDPTNRQEPANFITEPDRAFAERAAPLAAMATNSAAMTARMTFKDILRSRQRTKPGNRDAFLYDKYEGEIFELAKTVPAVQLGNIATWEHLFFNVKGRHADEIADALIKDDKTYFGAEVGGGTPPERLIDVDKTKLTDVEKAVAKKFGISEDEYLKQRGSASSLPSMPGVTQ
jgi:hypothetical protein